MRILPVENETELPKFPDDESTEKKAFSQNSLTGKEDPDITALSKDLVVACFEIANLINKKIRPLDEEEAKEIGKPLARICIKYNLARYLGKLSYMDEIMLTYTLGKAIIIRVKEVKASKEIKDDRSYDRAQGQGQDTANEKFDISEKV